MAQYTSVANVKDDLGIVGTSKDALILRYIKSASIYIKNKIGYELQADDYDEYYDVKETPRKKVVYTKHKPINSIDAITVNGGVLGIDDYELYEDHIYIYGVAVGKKQVQIEYNAGYLIDWDNVDDPLLHNLPDDIELATRLLVVEMYNTKSSGQMLKSETIGSWTRTFMTVNERDKGMIDDILNNYTQFYI